MSFVFQRRFRRSNANMPIGRCNINTNTSTFCSHCINSKERYTNNTSKPKLPCQKLNYNETWHTFCPKCKGVQSTIPTKTMASSRPLPNNIQSSNITLQDIESASNLLTPKRPSSWGKRVQELTGMKKLAGSLRGNRNSSGSTKSVELAANTANTNTREPIAIAKTLLNPQTQIEASSIYSQTREGFRYPGCKKDSLQVSGDTRLPYAEGRPLESLAEMYRRLVGKHPCERGDSNLQEPSLERRGTYF